MATPAEPPPIIATDPASNPDPATPAEAAPETPTEPVAGGEDNELRSLVQELIKQSSLGFDPATIRKGDVTVINPPFLGTPTLDLLMSGDTTATLTGVRYLDSYSPVLGDTVLVIKQGPELIVLGRVAINTATDVGWVQATLPVGFTHNGNSQGNLMYRRSWDNGTWKVQFKGTVGRTSGETVIATLPTDYRPVNDVVLIAARGFGGGSTSIQIKIATTGAVTLEGNTYNIGAGSNQTAITIQNTGASGTNDTGGMDSLNGPNTSTLVQNTGTFGSAPNTGGVADNIYTTANDFGPHNHLMHHTHFGSGHTHDMNHAHGTGHTHNGPSHIHDFNHLHTMGSVTITSTDWISFHGLEYCLS